MFSQLLQDMDRDVLDSLYKYNTLKFDVTSSLMSWWVERWCLDCRSDRLEFALHATQRQMM